MWERAVAPALASDELGVCEAATESFLDSAVLAVRLPPGGRIARHDRQEDLATESLGMELESGALKLDPGAELGAGVDLLAGEDACELLGVALSLALGGDEHLSVVCGGLTSECGFVLSGGSGRPGST